MHVKAVCLGHAQGSILTQRGRQGEDKDGEERLRVPGDEVHGWPELPRAGESCVPNTAADSVAVCAQRMISALLANAGIWPRLQQQGAAPVGRNIPQRLTMAEKALT